MSGLSDPYNDNGKPKSNLISWSWWGSILTHKLMKCLGKIAKIQENISNSLNLIGIQDTHYNNIIVKILHIEKEHNSIKAVEFSCYNQMGVQYD